MVGFEHGGRARRASATNCPQPATDPASGRRQPVARQRHVVGDRPGGITGADGRVEGTFHGGEPAHGVVGEPPRHQSGLLTFVTTVLELIVVYSYRVLRPTGVAEALGSHVSVSDLVRRNRNRREMLMVAMAAEAVGLPSAPGSASDARDPPWLKTGAAVDGGVGWSQRPESSFWLAGRAGHPAGAGARPQVISPLLVANELHG